MSTITATVTGMTRERTPQPGMVWAPPLGEVSEKTADTYRAARDDQE